MNNEKINLEELQVESFITSLTAEEQAEHKGGCPCPGPFDDPWPFPGPFDDPCPFPGPDDELPGPNDDPWPYPEPEDDPWPPEDDYPEDEEWYDY